MTDPFVIRPDRLHRYVYLVFAALLVLAGVGFVAEQDAKLALIGLGGGAFFGWVGWWRMHDRIVVSSQGRRAAGACMSTTTYSCLAHCSTS